MGTVKRIRQLFKLSVLSIFLGTLPMQMANAVDDPISAGGNQTQTPRQGGLGTTDSTALDKRENPKIMQPMTSAVPASSVGIYGYDDANYFITNIGNKCTANTTLPVCYTRVSVTALGASIPNGGATCPDGYETLMNYGSGVMLDSTGEQVYHYAEDWHDWTDIAQWNWYWTEGYHLEVCPTWDRWTLSAVKNVGKNAPNPYIYDGTAGSGSSNVCTAGPTVSPPCDAYVPDDTTGGREVGWLESADCHIQCFTAGDVPMANCGYSIAGDYSKWFCDFNMLCRSIGRAAGFYPAPANNNYPVGARSSDIAPTIKICGKKQLIWREKE